LIINFPAYPENGTIFEVDQGVYYQYEAATLSWIELASNTISLPTATSLEDGAMQHLDFQKLNRLIIPPPISTIVGNDCVGPFNKGILGVYTVDDFINVEGSINIRNISETGEEINELFPWQIHQHAYGFNFTLNIPYLVTELKRRGQFNVVGNRGPDGNKGDDGDPGIDNILSGPQGEKGDKGNAPQCTITVEDEPLTVIPKSSLNKAITAIRVKPDGVDPSKYTLECDRKIVGKETASAKQFNLRNQNSTWILAVASISGIPQSVYCIDIDPIIEVIHNKFLSEIDRLKTGYEDIVKFWIQKMSDLFDEQKEALCCALEFCISKTKNDHLRRHMEIVAATALPNARIAINKRGSIGDQPCGQTEVQGTALIPNAETLCAVPPPPPPPPPSPPPPPPPPGPCSGSNCQCNNSVVYNGGVSFPTEITIQLGSDQGTVTLTYNFYNVPDKIIVEFDGKEVINTGYRGKTSYQSKLDAALTSRGGPNETIVSPGSGSATFDKNSSTTTAIVKVYGPLNGTAWRFTLSCPSSSSISAAVVTEYELMIDPTVNISSANLATINLAKGQYTAIIESFDAQIDGKYSADVCITHITRERSKTTRFLNKGTYNTLIDAKNAYEGLAISFNHDGGEVGGYLRALPTVNASGSITLKIMPEMILEKKSDVLEIKEQLPISSKLEAETKIEATIETIEVDPHELSCDMAPTHLAWYERSWDSGNCCGFVVNISGQDYIIVKRSLDTDSSCGGGESSTTPCIAQFKDLVGHPAFAWPTIDGKSFAPIPSKNITFTYDKEFNKIVNNMLRSKLYDNVKGNCGLRHLLHQFEIILFPVG